MACVICDKIKEKKAMNKKTKLSILLALLMVVTILAPLLMLTFLNVSGWLLVPVLLLYGFVSISPGPVFLALIQDHFPENRAVSNGLYISMSFLLRSLALLLVGVAGDAFGLRVAFLGSAALSLLGLGGIFMLPVGDK